MKERVFRYRAVERALVASRSQARVLDVGCGPGDNLRRLVRYGARPVGIDPNRARVRESQSIAPAVVAPGETLPFADGVFDLVYVSHVFHHARDLDACLRECGRVLAPGGVLFVIETVDDSPLMRLARALQPRWDDDDVLNRFRYAELRQAIATHGFSVLRGETFNWLYFAWELGPLAFRPLELLTPLFIAIEVALRRVLDPLGGHCWLLAQKPGANRFPALESAVRAPTLGTGSHAAPRAQP